ncbi:MAG: isoprenyl transferase [Bacteroidetes bacterium]|nr:isoprenyl transferase [Bacteroidota bacterium]
MSFKDKIIKDRIPAHVAIIMDGNGRWAKKRGFLRTLGHEKGVDAVRETVEAAAALGISFITLYAFSTENWNRPRYEINALMKLLVTSVNKERKTFMDNNIRLLAIGDLKNLPARSQGELKKAIEDTSGNTGLRLVLALSYSSRWEIVEAARSLARQVSAGTLKADEINADSFSGLLTTAEIPDPELLIRTSGECRVSNFLLWQIAYSELYFTPTLWPDFTKEDFYKAIVDYQGRERRFGLTSEQIKQTKNRHFN